MKLLRLEIDSIECLFSSTLVMLIKLSTGCFRCPFAFNRT